MAHPSPPAQRAPGRPSRGIPFLPALAFALALGAAPAEAGTAMPGGTDGPTAVAGGEESGVRDPGRRIAFIDAAVPDRETLIEGFPPSVEVVVLDPGRDGVAQIAERLGARPGSRGEGLAIDLISHGSPGELLLGGGVLDPASPRGPHARLLAEIGEALADDARILVYGCRFGAGERGREAVRALADATGAAVAASEDITGSASLGGDWDLEVTAGRMAASAPVVGAEARASWRGTLQELPTLQFRDGDGDPVTGVDVSEGDGTVRLTVELSAAATGTVTVDWRTVADGVRPATPGSDYTSASGTLTFLPGDTSETIAVAIADDSQDEEDEEGFRISLSNPSGARFATPRAPSVTVTVQDNDDLPEVSIESAQADEDAGEIAFTVALTPASGRVVILNYRTEDGSAVAPGDYTGFQTEGAGDLIFLPGETSKTISVPVIDDGIREGDETFTVVLSRFRPANGLPAHSTLPDPEATGTIVDDEPGPVLSIAGTTVDEGAGSATFVVTLAGATTQAVTVDYATSDGTAVAASDYTAATGTLTFQAGTTRRNVVVDVLDDETQEPNETFTVTLSDAANAELGQASATATIRDDDEPDPVLSIAGTTVDEGAGSATFVVTLTGTSTQTVTVDYATSDGTAVAASDYTARTGTLTFPAGTTRRDVVVTVLDDETQEPNETFTVTLSDAANAGLGQASATATIRDDDEPDPVLSIAGTTVDEGDGSATFVVTLTGTSTQAVTVDYATSDGTAVAASDYTAATGTLTFQAGTTTRNVVVDVLDDETQEPNETFTVTLSDATNAELDQASATATIRDDDDPGPEPGPEPGPGPGPVLSITGTTVDEDDGSATFVVTLAGATTQAVTVDYATSDGTAVAASDYTARTGTLTFPAGTTRRDVVVTVLDDETEESNETFTVTLSGAANAGLGQASATATIVDDDGDPGPEPGPGPGPGPGPVLSISGTTVGEGARSAAFAVTLVGASTQAVTVDYATSDGTAVAASDYTARTGTLTFPAGTTRRNVVVTVLDDETEEPNETFTVTLSGAANAGLGQASATATIIDDDGESGPGPGPVLSISGTTVGEGAGSATFAVTLIGASAQAVTVGYATSDGTAEAASDYTARTGTLTFPAGTTRRDVVVTVLDDETEEPNETFTVTLSDAANAGLGQASATATIVDDDGDDGPGPEPGPVLSISGTTVGEGAGSATFVVTLTGTSAQAVTVGYATSDGTAVAASDYTARTGTLTFPAGTTRRDVVVTVLDDETEEPNETFTVTLSDASNAGLGQASATATIIDDDGEPGPGPGPGPGPVLSIAGTTVGEGAGSATFVVTLTGTSAQAVTVHYATSDGTAVAASDYTARTGTLTFPAGTTRRDVVVTVLDDETEEPNETFTVTLSDASNAGLGQASATATIIDDDGDPGPGPGPGPGPVLSIAGTTVGEGAGSATFAVTLAGTSAQDVTVDYATSDGTAVAASDYTATTGTLTFPAGTTTRNVVVDVLDDTAVEDPETFMVRLSDAANAGLGQASATATILDDDGGASAILSIDDVVVSEADGVALLTVTLAGTAGADVTVDYATSDGTAEAASDYTARTGTLTFPAGTTTQDLSVTVLDDETQEPNETFTVTLGGENGAALGKATGRVTITDDDGAGEVPVVAPPSVIPVPVVPEISRAMLASALDAVADCLAQAEREQGAGAESLASSLSARSAQPWHGAMAGSPFGLSLADGEGEMAGGVSMCGSGDYRRLSAEGTAGWRGRLLGAHFGAGIQFRDGVQAGILVSGYEGSIDYTDRSGGRVSRGANDISLTGIQPYLGWSPSDGSRVWATAGHGAGEIDAERDGGQRLSSDVTLTTLAVGGGLLLNGGGPSLPGDGIRLELKGEAGFARLDVDGNDLGIPGQKADIHRIRLALRATRDHVLSSGAVVALSAELGARHDGGDGEAGSGVEVGGGLRHSDPARGVALEANGRVLVAHGGGLDEWGLGGSFRFDPGSDGHGLQFSLLPAWGEPKGGIARLWEGGATPRGSRREARLGMEAGYGAPIPGGAGTLTVYGGLDVLEGGRRSYRAGSRISLSPEAGLSLEGRREETLGREVDHGIFLEGQIRL